MKFSTQELMDIAISIEDIGYYFYTRCRDKYQNEAYRNLLGFLAEEELRHKELFEKMVTEAGEILGFLPDEYYQYIKAIGKEQVFTNTSEVDNIIDSFKSIEDVIKFALIAEKDSILYYSELLQLYEDREEPRSVLSKLINEERKHIVSLLDLRENLHLSEQ